MKLEVVIVPVSDVDRAKAVYEKLGFRLDIDYVATRTTGYIVTTGGGNLSLMK
jgi:catechol 2,3-dioxygenase-like lactoylglutathione lyase family enzyme